MAWATNQDVIDRWIGGDLPADTNVIDALIADAETVIVATYPGIQARITAGNLSEDLVSMVVVRMVTRILRNPGNVTYLQQSTGPFSQGTSFGNGRDVWLSEDEKSLLAPSNRGKAFEVNQGYDAALTVYDTIWVEVS
jgi:hypothetical protein